MLVAIPSVDRVLNMDATQALIAEYGRTPVVMSIRSILAAMRDSVTRGDVLPHDTVSEPAIAERLGKALEKSADESRLLQQFRDTGAATVAHT